jgi:putative transposase
MFLGTHFVTTDCYEKKSVLQCDRMAGLFVDVLQHYRCEKTMQVHEFIVMPDHVHVMLSTTESEMMAVKRIKGCFSTRAIKEFEYRDKIWQPSFYCKWVNNVERYQAFGRYIRQNPVKAGLVTTEAEWRFSSASGEFAVDPAPEWMRVTC